MSITEQLSQPQDPNRANDNAVQCFSVVSNSQPDAAYDKPKKQTLFGKYIFMYVLPFVITGILGIILMEGIGDGTPISLAIYFGSVLFATLVSVVFKFAKYNLEGPATGVSTFICCLLFWPVAFLFFLINFFSIVASTATARTPEQRSYQSSHAFILLSLFIGIIAAIAIPCLLPSRIQANETNAIASLREYYAAQAQFMKGRFYTIPGNTNTGSEFCDNFRNLYYGVDDKGEQLRLISKTFADAFIFQKQGTPTVGNPTAEASPFQGYLFIEDPYIVNNGLSGKSIGLLAYPFEYRKSGYNVYWIGSEGVVYQRNFGEKGDLESRLIKGAQSPLSLEAQDNWVVS